MKRKLKKEIIDEATQIIDDGTRIKPKFNKFFDKIPEKLGEKIIAQMMQIRLFNTLRMKFKLGFIFYN